MWEEQEPHDESTRVDLLGDRHSDVGRGFRVWRQRHGPAADLGAVVDVAEFTDRYVELETLGGLDTLGAGLVEDVRAAMAPDPSDPDAQATARTLVEAALRPLLPVDDEGLLVNAIVAAVEESPEILRVGQVCERFDLTERTLQRLTSRRLGLSPKWLIRRRRLHEAAGLMRLGETDLATVAAELGYTDQAHLTRDFRAATGMTPGAFARRWRQTEE